MCTKCSMNFLYQFERGPHAPSAPPAISECDSESDDDDDDEVVAFVDESDNGTEVPVNTPGSTRTRAGRLSIPNLRYLDWLA